ncbi:MAG TPA: type I methionyl aminopeptidase [Candidatus Acidoferrales bacterium]|nr:type I methionyl aminopeptidase [Candidatus Acidoferrales bacterium]
MIVLKSQREIEIMRRANMIVAEILAELKEKIAPGVTTLELDALAEELAHRKKARPAFKGYVVAGRVYPYSLCTSVNEEVVHGMPSERALKPGDIIGIDFGVVYEGFYGDAALTVAVGPVSPQAQRLMEVTEQSLYRGIEQIGDGKRLGEVSSAIQKFVEGSGFSVVREFVGHGIGKNLHEEPPVPNYGEPYLGPRLRAGMVLAIEPMVTAGRPEVEVKEDGWTAVTRDQSLAAHFEHSVAVTKDGPYILSKI